MAATCQYFRPLLPSQHPSDLARILVVEATMIEQHSTEQPLSRTPYAALGGADALCALVVRFYELMDAWAETHALRQRHLQDLSGSQRNLLAFLSVWLGGPPPPSEVISPTLLLTRPKPFAVGTAERNQWMMCMRTALNERVPDPDLRAALIGAFAQMVDHLIKVSVGMTSSPSSRA